MERRSLKRKSCNNSLLNFSSASQQIFETYDIQFAGGVNKLICLNFFLSTQSLCLDLSHLPFFFLSSLSPSLGRLLSACSQKQPLSVRTFSVWAETVWCPHRGRCSNAGDMEPCGGLAWRRSCWRCHVKRLAAVSHPKGRGQVGGPRQAFWLTWKDNKRIQWETELMKWSESSSRSNAKPLN